MALRDHFPRWLQRLLIEGSNVLKTHAAIEATFVELKADLDQVDADTVITEASDNGLMRWGIDLAEPRLPNQSDEQYAGALKAIKQGRLVNQDGLDFAVEKYGINATILDRSDPDVFADLAFADVDAVTISPERHVLALYDEWDPDSGLTEADFAQRCVNSADDVFRVKAAGVRFTPYFPSSVTP